jgi:hypothetical protein
VKPARRLLSLSMKTIQYLCRQLLKLLRFGQEVILYALIFISAFFRSRASLGCEPVAIRSQLTFYKESIRQKRQTRPRFTPAFRLLWVLLSAVWSGWKPVADLMLPKTVLNWHKRSFLLWWRWKSRSKGGRLWFAKIRYCSIGTVSRRLSRRPHCEYPVLGIDQ